MTLVAVLGGGQLGRMLGLAGARLGLRLRFLDPDRDAPARHVGELIVGAYDDPGALRRLVDGAVIATYEFENVPLNAVAFLHALAEGENGPATGPHDASRHSFRGVFPSARSLEVAQDRLNEKRFFQALTTEAIHEVGDAEPLPRHRVLDPSLPRCSVQRFAPIDDERSLDAALDEVGIPAVLKTRRMGYDGKGQAVIRSRDDARGAWQCLGGAACILEAFVPFQREVSIIGVRGHDGSIAIHPLVENVHREGILHTSTVPATDDAELGPVAALCLRRAMERLDHVGALCIEFFVHDGGLVVNEMAPRVHNSGHWTIEGAATSQFENHLRAILGLPLGSPAARGPARMLNLVGTMPSLAELLADRDAAVHLYGKAPRPGRKLGHVTWVGVGVRPIAQA